MGGGSDMKILVAGLESERPPDIAVYKRPPEDEQDLWATWIPDLVVEVVSPTSVARDYEEKREEYLLFGVREYWIIDAERDQMLVLRRAAGQWREQIVRPPEVCMPTLFPGLSVDLAAIFRAARAG